MLLYDSEFYIIKSESKVRQLPATYHQSYNYCIGKCKLEP